MDTLRAYEASANDYIQTDYPGVLCGDKRLADNLLDVLRKFRVTHEDVRYILLDYPRGWALSQELDFAACLIATDNPCPDYLSALSELKPFGLLTTLSDYAIARALLRGHKEMPTLIPKLSPSERCTLKLAVNGLSNKQIAKARQTSPGVVENCLSIIYRKLSLKSRVELAHYFYGNWHLLPDRKQDGE